MAAADHLRGPVFVPSRGITCGDEEIELYEDLEKKAFSSPLGESRVATRIEEAKQALVFWFSSPLGESPVATRADRHVHSVLHPVFVPSRGITCGDFLEGLPPLLRIQVFSSPLGESPVATPGHAPGHAPG